MRILFAGTPEPAVHTLKALIESKHEVVGVLTQPDAPGKRGRSLHPSAVSVLAEEFGIPTLKPEKASDEQVLTWVRSLQAEVAIVVAYGQLLPHKLLACVPGGFFNVHFSILPRWRGAAPVQRAIQARDPHTGVSIFKLDEGLDTGLVALVEKVALHGRETSAELLELLASKGARLAVQLVDSLEAGHITLTKQAEQGATYAKKLTPQQGMLVATHPREQIHAQIRAFADNPGAYFTFRGQRIKVLSAGYESAPEGLTLAPGELFATKRALYLGTGTSPLHLESVAPAGKKSMKAADWARGAHLERGEKIDEASSADHSALPNSIQEKM